MSETPRTDGQEEMHWYPPHASRFCRQLERELNAALDELEGARLRNISLILERDRWKAKAEEKIALRRELESELGVDSDMTSDEALQAGLEAIYKLKDEIDESNAALGDMRSAMAAHMSVCGNDPIPVHRTYCSRCAECGKETK